MARSLATCPGPLRTPDAEQGQGSSQCDILTSSSVTCQLVPSGLPPRPSPGAPRTSHPLLPPPGVGGTQGLLLTLGTSWPLAEPPRGEGHLGRGQQLPGCCWQGHRKCADPPPCPSHPLLQPPSREPPASLPDQCHQIAVDDMPLLPLQAQTSLAPSATGPAVTHCPLWASSRQLGAAQPLPLPSLSHR